MLTMGGSSSSGLFGAESLLQEQHVAASKTGHNKIAIIRVEGAILDNDGFIKQQIDQVRQDDRVKGVVLRVDSPGGTSRPATTSTIICKWSPRSVAFPSS